MKTRVWIALDKSARSQSEIRCRPRGHECQRRFDRQGRTLEGEQFIGRRNPIHAADFTDPATGDTHTEFSLRFAQRDNAYQIIGIQWQGKKKFGGGYTANPDEETIHALQLTRQRTDPVAKW